MTDGKTRRQNRNAGHELSANRPASPAAPDALIPRPNSAFRIPPVLPRAQTPVPELKPAGTYRRAGQQFTNLQSGISFLRVSADERRVHR